MKVYLLLACVPLFSGCEKKNDMHIGVTEPASRAKTRNSSALAPDLEKLRAQVVGQRPSDDSARAQVDTTDGAVTKSSVISGKTHDEGFSYGNLEKELIEIQKKLPWPRSEQQEKSYREAIGSLLDVRQRLLFSIPISKSAEADRDAAWDFLDFGQELAVFTDEQFHYAKKLLNGYSSSPAIEKLVIWELVRTRMDHSMAPGGARGLSGSAEILLRKEMAKLLFSAFGVDKKELFDAVDLKTRTTSDEAERIASEAEEEIERLHVEQSKEAERILEKKWKP